MISLDSSNLVLARMIILEAVTARMRITVNPSPRPPPALKECIAHASAFETRVYPFIDPTAMLCW